MRRSILCIIIIASLILCSTSIAFANPLDPWTSVQADRVTNGVVSIDNTLSNVYTAISALYNYLKNNGDGVVEGLLVLANRVSNIISTIDYYLPNINTNLQNIYSSLAAHSGSNLDLWGLTNSILTNTNALATGQLGIAQDVYNISGYTNSIQSKLTTLNQTEISSLAKLTNIDTNINSLENINWIQDNNITVTYSKDNINYTDTVPSGASNDLYIKLTGVRYPNSLYNFAFPVYTNYFDYNKPINLSINYSSYDYEYFDNFLIIPYFTFTTVLLNPYSNVGSPSAPIIFHFSADYNIFFRTDSSYQFNAKRLDIDSSDYYKVANFIELSKLNNNSSDLSDIKNILIDIDNNSDFIQNNNDLQINVDIDSNDGQGITAIILKLQDLFDFGVGLQEFLVTLNQFDNLQWFTRLETYEQVNQDPRFSPGYIDLYD